MPTSFLGIVAERCGGVGSTFLPMRGYDALLNRPPDLIHRQESR